VPRKRTRVKIIMDILKHLSEHEETPTRLATLTNMPYDRLIPILEELREKGIIVFEAVEDNPRARTVKLTDKGWRLYLHLNRLVKVINDFGLDVI